MVGNLWEKIYFMVVHVYSVLLNVLFVVPISVMKFQEHLHFERPTTLATTLAATINLLRSGALPKDESIVVCITGNGYKTAHVMADQPTESTRIGRSLREFEAFMASRTGQPVHS